jgi:hypothetical protein
LFQALAPGAIAPEAAAIVAPVLIATGERDVIADPEGERRAHLSARSIDFFFCPRMGHMDRVCSTRELFWRRLKVWSEWVRIGKAAAEDLKAQGRDPSGVAGQQVCQPGSEQTASAPLVCLGCRESRCTRLTDRLAASSGHRSLRAGPWRATSPSAPS